MCKGVGGDGAVCSALEGHAQGLSQFMHAAQLRTVRKKKSQGAPLQSALLSCQTYPGAVKHAFMIRRTLPRPADGTCISVFSEGKGVPASVYMHGPVT